MNGLGYYYTVEWVLLMKIQFRILKYLFHGYWQYFKSRFFNNSEYFLQIRIQI